jgi:hypothetical protein
MLTDILPTASAQLLSAAVIMIGDIERSAAKATPETLASS